VLKRLGELDVINTTCPSEAVDAAGLFIVPIRPNKLLCSFQVSGLPPMDGAITPLVYLGAESATPLPAQPAVYRVAGAPRVPLGECAVLGATRSLRLGGSNSALEGQPRTSSSQTRGALPADPVCGSYSTSIPMTFGPFTASQCGEYRFSSTVSAKPFNTTRSARGSLSFAVEVTDCSSRASSRRNQPMRGGA